MQELGLHYRVRTVKKQGCFMQEVQKFVLVFS